MDRDRRRLKVDDVQMVEAHEVFEVWEGDSHLFDLPTDRAEVVRAALVGYNAGLREGVEAGRGEVQDGLRQLLGAASGHAVADLSDRLDSVENPNQ